MKDNEDSRAGGQSVAVAETVDDIELFWISLNGFSPPWHNFVQVIYDLSHLVRIRIQVRGH